MTQIVRVVCKLVSVVVMARLVAPEGYGDFAMAAAVFWVLALFRDAGLGTATIQAKTLSPQQMNGLFWVQLGMGGLLMAATWGLAPLADIWFKTDSVSALLQPMSFAFLIIGAGGFARAQLYREMRLAEANRLESLSAVIGTGAMVGAGWAGANAYAFVVFLLVSELVANALAWREISWRPSVGWKNSGLKSLWRVGGHVTLNHLVTYLSTQLDAILIGRWFGATAVGLYSRSTQLLTLPRQYIASPLSQIMLTTLARLKDNADALSQHTSRAVTNISHLVLPFYLVCIVLPVPTVKILLGADWLAAAPLLQILAIGRAMNTLTSMAETVNIALDRSHRLVGAALMSLVATTVAIIIGQRFGLSGIAWAVSLAQIMMIGPRLWWLLRDIPGSLRQYLRAIRGPLALSAITVVSLSASARLLENAPVGFILGGAILAAIGTGGIIYLVSRFIRREIMDTMKFVTGKWDPGSSKREGASS
ncbi:MAG: lipopolysaccharide biosynthesis protein [Opitutaceae bacterium]|nr:lipopolysaccharide biosynthesis protein [Opitutaceae bacterium]